MADKDAQELRDVLNALADKMQERCGDHCSSSCKICEYRNDLRLILIRAGQASREAAGAQPHELEWQLKNTVAAEMQMVIADGQMRTHVERVMYAINKAVLLAERLAAASPTERVAGAAPDYDPVGCKCDEFPECTHALYWYMGFKVGAAGSGIASGK